MTLYTSKPDPRCVCGVLLSGHTWLRKCPVLPGGRDLYFWERDHSVGGVEVVTAGDLSRRKAR